MNFLFDLRKIPLDLVKNAPVILRPLCLDDWDRGYEYLMSCSPYVSPGTELKFGWTKSEYINRFFELKNNGYFILVTSEPLGQTLIASGSLYIEKKFLNKVGHISDIIVHIGYRSRKIGRLIITVLTQMAKNEGCYKVTLDIVHEKYERLGYKQSSGCMTKYFNSLDSGNGLSN